MAITVSSLETGDDDDDDDDDGLSDSVISL
jgi:hypothetical protein